MANKSAAQWQVVQAERQRVSTGFHVPGGKKVKTSKKKKKKFKFSKKQEQNLQEFEQFSSDNSTEDNEAD